MRVMLLLGSKALLFIQENWPKGNTFNRRENKVNNSIRFKDYASEYAFKERAGPGFQEHSIKYVGMGIDPQDNKAEDNESADRRIIMDKNKPKISSKDDGESDLITDDRPYSDKDKIKYSDDGEISGVNGRIKNTEGKHLNRFLYKPEDDKANSVTSGNSGDGIKASGGIKYYTGSKVYGSVKRIGKKGFNIIKKNEDYDSGNIYTKEINGLKETVKKLMGAVVSIVGGAVASPILIAIMICILLVSITTVVSNVISESEIRINPGAYPESVLQWQSFVVERCEANNDPDSQVDLRKFTAAILTTIWQESGGNSEGSGGDLMQCLRLVGYRCNAL